MARAREAHLNARLLEAISVGCSRLRVVVLRVNEDRADSAERFVGQVHEACTYVGKDV